MHIYVLYLHTILAFHYTTNCLFILPFCFINKEHFYSREKIINKCLEGIRIHGYFSGLLNVLDIFWNDSNISVDTIQNTLLGRLRRYDISEMIFMIQLSSYNFNYEEAMKPDDYKEIDGKNDVLNDVINRFVNEQVRENGKVIR